MTAPTFDEFIRPLVGVGGGTDWAESSALSELPAGDYAVMAWLDAIEAQYTLDAATEASIVAAWDSATLRDVYALVFAGTDRSGGRD